MRHERQRECVEGLLVPPHAAVVVHESDFIRSRQVDVSVVNIGVFVSDSASVVVVKTDSDRFRRFAEAANGGVGSCRERSMFGSEREVVGCP
jgi:hypothetical protein